MDGGDVLVEEARSRLHCQLSVFGAEAVKERTWLLNVFKTNIFHIFAVLHLSFDILFFLNGLVLHSIGPLDHLRLGQVFLKQCLHIVEAKLVVFNLAEALCFRILKLIESFHRM